MQPPFPCPTATWRNDTYEAISPLRSELSAAGKTVVVIGAVRIVRSISNSDAFSGDTEKAHIFPARSPGKLNILLTDNI